jgi:hypothetical protein
MRDDPPGCETGQRHPWGGASKSARVGVRDDRWQGEIIVPRNFEYTIGKVEYRKSAASSPALSAVRTVRGKQIQHRDATQRGWLGRPGGRLGEALQLSRTTEVGANWPTAERQLWSNRYREAAVRRLEPFGRHRPNLATGWPAGRSRNRTFRIAERRRFCADFSRSRDGAGTAKFDPKVVIYGRLELADVIQDSSCGF